MRGERTATCVSCPCPFFPLSLSGGGRRQEAQEVSPERARCILHAVGRVTVWMMMKGHVKKQQHRQDIKPQSDGDRRDRRTNDLHLLSIHGISHPVQPSQPASQPAVRPCRLPWPLYIHTNLHAHVHACIHIYIVHTHTYTHIWIHTCESFRVSDHVPQYHSTTVPLYHGTTESQNHRTTESQNHRTTPHHYAFWEAGTWLLSYWVEWYAVVWAALWVSTCDCGPMREAAACLGSDPLFFLLCSSKHTLPRVPLPLAIRPLVALSVAQ